MMIKGFKFGMVLQFAVGPVCLFLFQTSVAHGLGPAMKGVIGVSLVDALYIAAAILGLGALLRARPRLQSSIQIFGGIV
jgi:threonine/homoserine/homoserine lactone efflux protein